MESQKIERENLANKIAGEISLSETPGETIKKWRDIFKVSQRELAEVMDVMPSVISDYENGRRKSPGIKMINKIVTSLLEADERNGGSIIKEFANISYENSISPEALLDVREFDRPFEVSKFIERIDGEVVSGEENKKIYGYSVVDSVSAIINLSTNSLVRIYGSTTERALIFTNITRGRSPMVAIKVTNLKPALVVFHGIRKDEIDPLAVRIGEAEDIPVAYTPGNRESLLENLDSLF